MVVVVIVVVMVVVVVVVYSSSSGSRVGLVYSSRNSSVSVCRLSISW